MLPEEVNGVRAGSSELFGVLKGRGAQDGSGSVSRIQGRMGHSKQKDRLGKGMELRERCSSKKPAVNERGAWQDQPMKQLGCHYP